ncbi:MAG: fibrobacter succinogenes major paralogous domain-containing protein [Daejeonella sp.]
MKTKHFYIAALMLVAGIFLTVSCKKDKKSDPDAALTVNYNGFTYHTVKIGNQVWMVENLRTTTYRDGTALLDGSPVNTNWENANAFKAGAWCKYPGVTDDYGLLYNWYAVAPSGPFAGEQLAPEGWHIPSNEDWDQLYNHLGGDAAKAGDKLKEDGTKNWPEPNTGNNQSGFKGLPGGFRIEDNYINLTVEGVWWSSTPIDDSKAYVYVLASNESILIKNINGVKTAGVSVRCIQDPKL